MSANYRPWRKSSYSNAHAAECVELLGTLNAVRDSKNGDVLRLSCRSVAALLTAAKAELNHR